MTVVSTTITYLIGTPTAPSTPTRDVTKFVKDVSTAREVSASSTLKFTLNNPNGIFTDDTRDDYIQTGLDYVLLVQVAGRNVWRGVIIDKQTDDSTSGTTFTVNCRTDGEFMKRCLVTGVWNPNDYAYVEDVIEDMFAKANPRPWNYYGLTYQLQNGRHQDFDDMTDGATPTDWTEGDANGDWQVKEYLYDGTTPLYISEPRSARLRNTANNQHQVYLDKLYLEGSRIIVSFRVYYDSTLGNFQFIARLADEDNIQLCYARILKNGANVTVYLTDGAVARAIWGPAGPTSQWMTMRFVVDLDTDTYDFYFGNANTPARYGSDAGHANLGQWSAVFNNSMNLTNTGKNSVDRLEFDIDDQASGAVRTLYIDDVYALEGDPAPRHALTSEVRFSSTSLYDAITELCAKYNLEWRDFPAKFWTDRAIIETYEIDPDATAAITVSSATDIFGTTKKESSSNYKNFFVVKGKDDIIGMGADVASIDEHGYFPMEKSDTKSETINECEEFSEMLKKQYNRNSVRGQLSISGEDAGYEELLSLKPGDTIAVTNTKAGMGSAQKYVIEQVKCSIGESLEARIDVGDIWKSAAYLTYESIRQKKKDDTEEPVDIVHLRYLAARVAVTGIWSYGGTNPPANVSTLGVTPFGKKAIRHQQISNSVPDAFVDNYTERPTHVRLVDSAGACYDNGGGLITLDRWDIAAVAVDGDGNKYVDLSLYHSAALAVASYFTLARTELVSKRTFYVTETLGVADYVMELDNTEGIRVHDRITLTNAAGSTEIVQVAEVMGNKVQVYDIGGARAAIMPKGSIAECYCNVIAAADTEEKHQAVANNITVQVTIRFTNEETPTVQGQVTEDGLTKLAQRLREPGTIITFNNPNIAQRFFTASTVNLDIGDYVAVKNAAGQVEFATVTAIAAGVSFDTFETFTPGDYQAGDTAEVMCFPWAYASYGDDDQARATNYYNSKRQLDGEVSRVAVTPSAPLMSDSLKLTVDIAGSAIPPAMANTYLDGNHVAQTLLHVESTDGMHPGQKVYIGNALATIIVRTIVTVNSATQITVNAVTTANDGDAVCTGLRSDTKDAMTLYEVGITDRAGETEESAIQYFLGRFLLNKAKVNMGFGAYQWDEYTNEDSNGSELAELGLGAGAPTEFYSDDFSAVAARVTDVEGTGISLRPLTRAWTVNVRKNPLIEKKGRSPSLQELLNTGYRINENWMRAIDTVGVEPDMWYANKGEREYSRWQRPSTLELIDDVFNATVTRDRSRLESSFKIFADYKEEQWYKGLLLEFDARGVTNIEQMHPDKLVFAMYGFGHSWKSGDDTWRNGVYTFVWVSGNGENPGNVVEWKWIDKDMMDHWEYVPMVDPSGNDIDSTTIGPALLIGSLGGGSMSKKGNQINRAIQKNGRVYVLVIPRYIDLLQKNSYVSIDYATLGINVSPLDDDTKLRMFRKGIDYLWSRDWDWIAWPGSSPTGTVTITTDLLGQGGEFVWVTNTQPFTAGEAIYIENDPYTIISIADGDVMAITPPARKQYAIGTAVKKSHYDYATNIDVDRKSVHPMCPMPTLSLATGAGDAYYKKIIDFSPNTITVKDTSGFTAGETVMLFDPHTMEKEWVVIQSMTKKVITLTLPINMTIKKKSTRVGKCTIPFTTVSDSYMEPQQPVNSYEHIKASAGRYNSMIPDKQNDDIATDFDRAGLPGVMVDWIDETNGLLYMSVAHPYIAQRTHATDTIAGGGITLNRTLITLQVGGLNNNRYKDGWLKVTDVGGNVYYYSIWYNTADEVKIWEQLDAAIAPGDTIELTRRMGDRFVEGYDSFTCINAASASELIFYTPRLLVTAAGGGAPTVSDFDGDQSIVNHANDQLRCVRGTRLFINLDGLSANGIIWKAGAAKDEVNWPIRNDNLCCEEQDLTAADDESCFVLNAKHGPGWHSQLTTGKTRLVIDIADDTAFLGGGSTLTAKAYVGATTLTVAAAAGYVANDIILLNTGTSRELAQVQSVVPPFTLNLYEPLRKSHNVATAVNRTNSQKVVIDLENPYGPAPKNSPMTAIKPQRYGATYRVTYVKSAGKVLARALLDDADISTPVTVKRDERLKSGIELIFDFD